MPKATLHELVWSSEQSIYLLYEQENRDSPLLQGNTEAWFAWLVSHISFSFQGKYGHLTLQKEARPHGGEGYWYAYQRQGRRMVKKYLGRSTHLTTTRLETAAQALGMFRSETSSDAQLSSPRTEPALLPQGPIASPQERGDVLHRSGKGSTIASDLLMPKIHFPRLSSSLVVRERLLSQLESGLERKVTLLSAPAGFGKTTLVSQWVAQRRAHDQFLPIAWLSLEESDNDPIRFWHYVIVACQSFQNAFSHSALALLHSVETRPFERRSLETVLTIFLNEVSQLPQRGVLVLEDYHVITSPQIHNMITFFLDHLPATLHLILITRVDPPLPLARFRAHLDLYELHTADLRFSQEETATFLQQAISFPLSNEVLLSLNTQMEGWVTGLRLVALTLQGGSTQQEIEHKLATFSGNHRYLLEFFSTEVLSAQPKLLQTFLLQTSFLTRLTGSLCDMVTGNTGSDRLLEVIERTNLFLLPLDGTEQWYRYHPLFAEAMQHESRLRLGAERLSPCLRRASVWYEQHGMLLEAVDVALQAQAFMQAALLMGQLLGPRQFHELPAHHTLRRWREALPEAVLEQHPELCIRFAIVQLFSSGEQMPPSFASIEPLLQMAERGFQAKNHRSGQGEVLAFRAMMARLQGQHALAARLAQKALPWLSERETQWRGTCVSCIGEEELLSGQLHTARQTLLEAQALYESARNRYATRAAQLRVGDVCFLQGELRQAAEVYRAVLIRAEEDRSDKANALLGLAQLSYEWNDLEAAEREAHEACELGQSLADASLQAHASVLLARVHSARGEHTLAQQMLHTLLARMQPLTSRLLHRELLSWLARLQLVAGNLSGAQHWFITKDVHKETVPRLQHEQEDLVMARFLLAQRMSAEAIHVLEPWRSEAHQYGRTRSEVEIVILLAQAYDAGHHEAQASLLLGEALTLAHAEGYQRLFLDEGETMVPLLRGVFPTVGHERLRMYTRTLLFAFATSQSERLALSLSGTSHAFPQSDPLESLSPQEQRVLHLLGTGSTNLEIAETFVVSINTVKTQVQSIFRKLNVKDRKEAREVARHLNLL